MANDRVIEYLEGVLSENPTVSEIVLTGAGLDEVEPILDILASFPDLRRLDFSGNNLQHLPEDMSALRALEAIDLTNNAFAGAADAIEGLKSLPGLVDLSIELNTEDDELAVFESFPDLHVLNGTSVLAEDDDDDEEDNGDNDGDRLSVQDSVAARGRSAEDAAASADGSFDRPAESAGAGGAPEHASVRSGASPLGSDAASDAAAGAAAGAAAANGTAQSQRQPTPPAGTPPAAAAAAAAGGGGGEVSLTQDDLEDVAVLYGTMKVLKGAVGAVMSDDEMEAAFDGHVQRTMQDLETRLSGVDDPYLRQSHILLAKHALYDVCFAEAIEHAEAASPDFAGILRRLRTVHGDLFGAAHAVVEGVGPHYASRLAEAQAERARGEEEARELLKAAEQLEREAAEHAEDKRELAKAHAEEMTRAQRETRRLRTELVRAQRGGSGSGGGGGSRGGSGGGGGFGSSSGSGSRERAKQSPPKAEPGAAGSTEARGGGGEKAVTVRRLSLRQLKDYIEAIYASKVKFDAKCAEGKLPRETMEQHMYTFLNQRYGLKSIIVEQATAILKATHALEEKDNVVQVFSRILAHDIDEEFHLVQEQLTETARELLRVYLKGKFPRKSGTAIQRMHEERMKGDVFEEEWKDIVQYMYNAEDAARVIEQLQARVQAPAPSPQRTRGLARAGAEEKARRAEEAARGAVAWDTFLKVLLDFQLAGHERYLARFRTLFRRFNPKRDGVLGEGEFRDLVVAVDPSKTEEQIEALLAKVDPYTNQRITFSDCVAALPAEIVAMSSAVGAGNDFEAYSASASSAADRI